MKVSLDKTYTDGTGTPMRILCTDAMNSKYPVVAITPTGEVRTYTACGRYCSSGGKYALDLVEVIPASDWPMDAKIFVRGGSPCDEWRPRHFAGVGRDGYPLAWNYGTTSFTGENKTSWTEAKLA